MQRKFDIIWQLGIATFKEEMNSYVQTVNKSWNIINYLSDGYEILEYSSHVDTGVHILENAIDFYFESYKAIRDIITSARHGKDKTPVFFYFPQYEFEVFLE